MGACHLPKTHESNFSYYVGQVWWFFSTLLLTIYDLALVERFFFAQVIFSLAVC